MDHKNENFNMFDLIAYRIKFVEHPHAGGWVGGAGGSPSPALWACLAACAWVPAGLPARTPVHLWCSLRAL